MIKNHKNIYKYTLVAICIIFSFFCFLSNSQNCKILHNKVVLAEINSSNIEIVNIARKSHEDLLRFCKYNCEQKYYDYKCIFEKQERINGILFSNQIILVKFRTKPFSIAMEWIENPPIADRIIYIENKNDDNMLARPTNPILRSITGIVYSKPDCEMSRSSTLKTIDKFGFLSSINQLLFYYELGRKNNDLIEEEPQIVSLNGRECLKLVRFLSSGKKYPAYKTSIYIDTMYYVPVLVEAINKQGDLLYKYYYRDIKFNIGLSNEDFEPENNGM